MQNYKILKQFTIELHETVWGDTPPPSVHSDQILKAINKMLRKYGGDAVRNVTITTHESKSEEFIYNLTNEKLHPRTVTVTGEVIRFKRN